jgi:hypothetical protein
MHRFHVIGHSSKRLQTLAKYRVSNDSGASQAVSIIVLNSSHFRNCRRCLNYFIKLWFRRMPTYPKTDVFILKWPMMTLRINFMHNGSEIDLHVSQQTIVFSFCCPRITCRNPWADAIADSHISKHLTETRSMGGKDEIPEMDGPDVVDQAILTELEERSFSLVRDLAKRTDIRRSMVPWWLTNSLGFVMKHLHWTVHRVNEGQLAARVQISDELLRITCSVEDHGWQSLLILHESWL